jgi:hypothetical protein
VRLRPSVALKVSMMTSMLSTAMSTAIKSSIRLKPQTVRRHGGDAEGRVFICFGYLMTVVATC